MAKLSETFTLGVGGNTAPSGNKLSQTFTINGDIPETTPIYQKRADNVIPDISRTLYTNKNGVTTTEADVDKWLGSDYKMSKDEKKQAREALRKMDKSDYKMTSRTDTSSDAYQMRNKLNYLDSKVHGGALAAGLYEGLVPFYDTLRKKYASDEDNAMYQGIKSDSKGAYTAGKIAGTMADYSLLGQLPIIGKVGTGISKALGGGKVAQAVGRIGADTLVDVALDTTPELVSNINEGKSGAEIAKDVAKNVGTNVAFNVLGEGVGHLIDARKAAKTAKADIPSLSDTFKTESSDIADMMKQEELADMANAVKRPDLPFEERVQMFGLDEPYGITNKEIDNILNTPELRQAWEETNGTLLKGTKAEQRKMIKDSLYESSDIANTLAKEQTDVLPDAMKRTDLINEERVRVPNAKNSGAYSADLPSIPTSANNVPLNKIDDVVEPINAKVINDVGEPASLAKNATTEINGNGALRQSAYANGLERTDIDDSVKQAFIDEPLIYNQLSNADTLAKADDVMANSTFDEAYKTYNDWLDARDPSAIPLGYSIANKLIKDGETEKAIEVVESMSKALTSSGQFSQAAAITMLKSDPNAALRMIQKDINKINLNGQKKFKKWVDFKLTDDEIKAFGDIEQGDTEAIQNLYEQITKRIADSYPSTMWEKIVETTKTAMMLNPRTHIRNVAANTVMSPVRSLADRVSAIGQNIVHLINPDFKVTQSLVGGTIEQKKIANQIFDEQIKPLLEGGNKWEDVVENAVRGKQVFSDSKVGTVLRDKTLSGLKTLNNLAGGKLQKLVDSLDEGLTGSAMENLRRFDYYLLGAVEDDPFVKSNFSNRLASYMKAQGIKTADDIPSEAIQTAYQEALKATFKDDNYMTKAFKGIKKDTGKFGEILLPFVKTPANLAKRGIEYSPVGFIETLLTSKGKETAEIIDELAKSATGTAGIYLGYKLAESGLIQGALSSNTKEREFEKQQGKQAFSINVNGNYYTFDWAQPASIPLVIGVTIYDAIKESDEENANYLNIAKQAVTASMDSWADLSPLSSLQEILGGGEYSSDSFGENVVNAVLDFPQRLIPSVSSATAKTIDPTVRQTYVKGNPAQTYLNEVKSKIPVLSQDLPAQYNTWGKEKLRQGSTESAAFANYINPGTLGYDQSTPIDSEIERLRGSVGGYTMYPNKAEWTIADGDENHKLTAEQYSQYQKSMGEKSYEMASKLIGSNEYQSLSDAERAEMLSKIYSLSKSMAENELVGKEIASTNSKLYSAYQQNGADGVIDYLVSKKKIENSGLSYSDKTLNALNSYGQLGLDVQKSIKKANTSSGAKLIPVLDEYNLSDSQKGEFLANNANLSDSASALADNGDYATLYTYYLIKAYADADNNGSLTKNEITTYLKQNGYGTNDINTWLSLFGK